MKNTFAVKDLSSVTLTIDDIDYATVGEYTVNLYATDESGNVADKEIKVIVNEPTLTIEQANVSIAVGETAQLNATVQGASQTITWTSSDTSIVTVNESGVVTGIKKERQPLRQAQTVSKIQQKSAYKAIKEIILVIPTKHQIVVILLHLKATVQIIHRLLIRNLLQVVHITTPCRQVIWGDGSIVEAN